MKRQREKLRCGYCGKVVGCYDPGNVCWIGTDGKRHPPRGWCSLACAQSRQILGQIRERAKGSIA